MRDEVFIREYKPGDELGIVSLFNEIFQQNMSLEIWRWKYKNHGLGTFAVVAEEGGSIVGHYGLVPRRVSYKGMEKLSAVVSDVMVHPSKRSAFTKMGIFYRLVKYSIEKFCPLSQERRILLGYGFPTTRAKDIGIKLGLYEEVEDAVEAEIINRPRHSFYSIKKCNLERDIVDKLWYSMKKSLQEAIINYRDYDSIVWRYAQPGASYSFYCVYNLIFPISIVVVRDDTDVKKIYDYIGDIKNLEKSLGLVAKVYNTHLRLRLPPWLANSLMGKGLLSYVDKVTLVANALTGPYSHELRGRFFYTYGDEDV